MQAGETLELVVLELEVRELNETLEPSDPDGIVTRLDERDVDAQPLDDDDDLVEDGEASVVFEADSTELEEARGTDTAVEMVPEPLTVEEAEIFPEPSVGLLDVYEAVCIEDCPSLVVDVDA